MRKLYTILLLLALALPQGNAQTSKGSTNKKASTASTAQKKTAAKTQQSTTSISNLKSQQAQVKKQIQTQQSKLRSNERDVQQRLQNLMVINAEIADKRKTIDSIDKAVNALNATIKRMDSQLDTLEGELNDRKDKFVKSMRYMHRNRSIQNQLMFIFSAKSLAQMYRRLRFTREYATFQRAQGEAVKAKQAQVAGKKAQIEAAKERADTLLAKAKDEQQALEAKQSEQEKVVATLKKQQKAIQTVIAEHRKKDAALNAEIDRLVAIEVEKARQRAIAEAKRKAEEEAARKKAEEEARKKAAAKATERAVGKSGTKAGGKSATAAKSKEPAADAVPMDSEDRRLSGNFESNRGRLPMPITGSYRIVNRYGQYKVDGLKNVTLDNKGINILGQSGAQARSVFDGEVSAVFSIPGSTAYGVMVRHGSYISVYFNLASVSVRKGQHVSTRQTLGTVASDNMLVFQLNREKTKLNPEVWLAM